MNIILKIRNFLHRKPRKNKRWRYGKNNLTKYEIE